MASLWRSFANKFSDSETDAATNLVVLAAATFHVPDAVILPLAFAVAIVVVFIWEVSHPRSRRKQGPSTIKEQLLGYSEPRRAFLAELPVDQDDPTKKDDPRPVLTSVLRSDLQAFSCNGQPTDKSAANFVLMPGGSVVFFGQHVVEASDQNNDVNIHLFRVGDMSRELNVEWATMNGTAFAGVDYVAGLGMARFEVGQDTLAVNVKLLSCNRFQTDRFFVVRINVMDFGTVGSVPFARVRIESTQRWPHGLPKPLPGQDIKERRFALWFHFMRMSVAEHKKYWNVVLAGFWMDFHHVVLNTMLLQYALYDFCFAMTDDPAVYKALFAIIGIKFIFVLFDRYADHIADNQVGVYGTTVRMQSWLLHKYLTMQDDAYVNSGRFYDMYFYLIPECIVHGFKPTYAIIRSVTVLTLSLSMAFVLPIISGKPVHLSMKPLYNLIGIVPFILFCTLFLRQKRWHANTERRHDEHQRVCGILHDTLQCRHWVRSFDGACPSQQILLHFDKASGTGYSDWVDTYFEYQHDTLWIGKYLGEMMKLLAVLYGSYAVINTARTGHGNMSIGEFAVFVNIYGAIVSALYEFIDASSSFIYSSVLLEPLYTFFELENEKKMRTPFLHERKKIQLAIRLQDVHVGVHHVGDEQRCAAAVWNRASVDVPLGSFYAVRSLIACDASRRQLGALLGGCAPVSCGATLIPTFARSLFIQWGASLSGCLLDGLMATAAHWVNVRDVIAVLEVLGIPFELNKEEQTRHGSYKLSPEQLYKALCEDREFGEMDIVYWETLANAFRSRMKVRELNLNSISSEIQLGLRNAEFLLIDLARGLLVDPEVLVVEGTLAGLPEGHGLAVLRVLKAWQRMGGLQGLVCAWQSEEARMDNNENLRFADLEAARSGVEHEEHYPSWITRVGGMSRTLVLSESALVAKALRLDAHIDAWVEGDQKEVRVIRQTGQFAEDIAEEELQLGGDGMKPTNNDGLERQMSDILVSMTTPKNETEQPRQHQIDVDVDTVIFVDCDGVINVGIGEDEGEGSISLDMINLLQSEEMLLFKSTSEDSPKMAPLDKTVELILACASRKIDGEDATYKILASDPNTCLCDVLVGRLVELITMAGDRRLVVLSSSWRRSKNVEKLMSLQHAMSEKMGKEFTFDATTAPVSSSGELPETRLQLIGDFVENICAERSRLGMKGNLKVMLLEDFDCTLMGTWACSGLPMTSTSKAEEYIVMRASGQITAKLIHTVDSWTEPDGTRMRLGAGLTKKYFSEAAKFLGHYYDQGMAESANVGKDDVKKLARTPISPSSSTRDSYSSGLYFSPGQQKQQLSRAYPQLPFGHIGKDLLPSPTRPMPMVVNRVSSRSPPPKPAALRRTGSKSSTTFVTKTGHTSPTRSMQPAPMVVSMAPHPLQMPPSQLLPVQTFKNASTRSSASIPRLRTE